MFEENSWCIAEGRQEVMKFLAVIHTVHGVLSVLPLRASANAARQRVAAYFRVVDGTEVPSETVRTLD